MEIGLFDIYSTGHHLPYAARTKAAIESVSNHNVTFVTLSETEQSTRLFEQADVTYLDEPDSPPIEKRAGRFRDVADGAIENFFVSDEADRFDVVHFLFSDDVLGSLWRHTPVSDRPRIVGELNGVFFKRGTVLRRRYIHPGFLWMLRTPVRALVNAAVPDRTSHEQVWRDLYLYRCLASDTFDHLVTHSKEAHSYVSKLNHRESVRTTQIPYPAPECFGTELSKNQARKRLGLPQDDSILLFFGTLRAEKGIERLLRVLRQYNGPGFTMHIAGPPATVSVEEVLAVKEVSSVKVITELEYIDTPEIYYRAADAMILPYTWAFGEECTSQSLEEASSSLLPVIVPDFGAVGRVTKEWELGTTYKQGSDKALEAAMRQFARDGVQHSKTRMKEYNRYHSEERIATELVNIYEGNSGSVPGL